MQMKGLFFPPNGSKVSDSAFMPFCVPTRTESNRKVDEILTEHVFIKTA